MGCGEVGGGWRSAQGLSDCMWGVLFGGGYFGRSLMQNVCVGTGPRSEKGISGSKARP